MAEGKVLTIHRVHEDGGPAEQLETAEIKTDFGMTGDYRSGHNPKRQITMVSDEVLRAVEEQLGVPVLPGTSRRQFMVTGLDLNELIGHEFRIGDVVLKGERECAPCQRMEEEIGPGARDALVGRGGLCCRVLAGGQIRSGDAIIPIG